MFNYLSNYKSKLPTPNEALTGRSVAIEATAIHSTLDRIISDNVQPQENEIFFGLGCFWGAERLFWKQANVHLTAVGYAGGYTPHPTYQEVCSGRTGHNEVVRIVYQDHEDTLEQLLKVFWEAHDPTQGMRQGNDVGTQYRSGIYYRTSIQQVVALRSMQSFQEALSQKSLGKVTTEIQKIDTFYYAEEYHQQYLFKNPQGYCGLKGTGVLCPIG